MYYSDRKDKTGPSKLIKELALFIIIDTDYAVLKNEITNIIKVSSRTILRYIAELNNCGINQIVTNPASPREYSYADECDESRFNLSMFSGNEPDQHMKKLKRVVYIFILFRYDFMDYMYFVQDPDTYFDDYDDMPEKVNVKALRTILMNQYKYVPDISVRTLERDIKDIYESLDFLANNYTVNI